MGGMTALALGVGSGLLTGVSAFGQAQAQSQQQKNQAKAMEAQAQMTRQQASLTEQRGQIEADTIDRQKRELRRQFEDTQAANRVSLGAGNVDMTSGSAMDVSLGNINAFAEDVGENEYNRVLKLWETNQNVKGLNWQADQYDANASYLKKTAGNLGTSLLTAGLAGLGAGLSAYQMFGGKFGGDGLAKSNYDGLREYYRANVNKLDPWPLNR